MPLEDEISEAEGEPGEARIRFRKGTVLDRINDNLIRRGVPALDPAAVLTRAQIKNRIRLIIKALLKAEIEGDPAARGYAGKTNAQIAQLLNEPYTTAVQVPDGQGGFVTANIPQTPRVCVVLLKIPFAPNAVRPAWIPEILA